jgi:hypothetical protein
VYIHQLSLILACTFAGAACAQTSPGSAERVAPATEAHSNRPIVRLLRYFQPSDPNVPLTGRKRVHDYLMQTLGPFTIVKEAAGAGLNQAVDSPPEWELGASGYGKRFASSMAYNLVRRSLADSTAALLHEDNRYFASGRHGIWPRIAYALESPLVARKDGHRVFSYSEAIGVVGAASISRAWEPESRRTGPKVASSIVISLAGTAGYHLFQEFVPDLIHHWSK